MEKMQSTITTKMTNTISLRAIVASLLLNISVLAYSQSPPSSFGDVTVEELQTEVCPIDSNAHAYFIFDYGESYFTYTDTKVRSNDPTSSQNGFQLYFKRHLRIKILNNQAFSWADFEIPLYHNKDKTEQTLKLKACTYNIENGEIVKSKLRRKDIYEEETNDNWTKEKFAMPAVREGSIIEIEYSIKSDFYFNLRPWNFQSTIPVMQSEYHVTIPEYFNYNQTEKGYFPIQKDADTKQSRITITYVETEQSPSGIAQTYTNSHEFKEDIFNYYVKEIPAFPGDEYLRTEKNYLSRIEYELAFTKFPNSLPNYYTTSWEKIDQNLMSSFRFGRELKQNAHIKLDAIALEDKYQDKNDLLNAAYNLIKNKIAWNEYNSIYPRTTLSEAYKKGSGNSADVNMNLVILLRELDIDAHPVILSTRKHGLIHPTHPSLASFNYVIAMVQTDDEILLMDATDPYSEINLLPIRCLNDQGRVVYSSNGAWVPLMDYIPYTKMEIFDIEINKELGVSGSSQVKLEDYAAYQFRKEVKSHTNKEEYKATLQKRKKAYEIHEFDISDLDTITDGINLSIGFSQKNYAEQADDITFFTPVYQPFISENPFKSEERAYPIEFIYPLTSQQMYVIKIPENFTISEIPDPLSVSTPDGKMKYVYNIDRREDQVSLSITFAIDKTVFSPERYQEIRAFYQLIIDKQKEFVVLKETP